MLLDQSLKNIMESILFVSDEPLSVEKLSTILELDKENTMEILEVLIQEYQTEQRGILLRKVAEGYQFVTTPLADPYISKLFAERKTRLSNAAYETLAIIAYRQPVSRSQIELIRGVKSDGPIQQLLARELIEEKGRLEQPGRPIIYGTTNTFLVAFDLNKIEDLPRFQECKEKDFKIENDEIPSLDLVEEG